MKKLFFIILILLLTKISFSQTYQAKYKIKIPRGINVTRADKVLCSETFDSGYIVKEEYKLNNKRSEFTINKIDTLRVKRVYEVYKTVETDLKSFEGWANIKTDEKDKSVLHLNYWLDDMTCISSGIRINIHHRKINLCGIAINDEDTSYTLNKCTKFYLTKIESEDIDSIKKLAWYITSNQIIDVYKKDDATKIDYYLVEKYDRNADYRLNLQNREFISFNYRSWDFGPLIIPFKYRFGYSKGNINVDPEFQSDLNIGFFGGRTFGKFRQRYEGDELKDLSKLSVTFGAFLNCSTVSLDSLSTTSGKVPLGKDEKKTIGILSPGIGIMTTIYNFQFGLLVGIDVGYGSNANNWNFNNKPWLGFGIGYNLSSIFWKM